jgi:hypothetical protein
MKFAPVQSSSVGEWDGQEDEAAEFLTDVQNRLAVLITRGLDDSLSGAQEYEVTELTSRVFFEDLCGNPDMLEWSDDQITAYVQGKFDDLTE